MPKRIYREAYASVRFMGADLNPIDVTKALRLPPDHQHRHGEPRLVRTTKGKVEDYGERSGGLWLMSSQSWVDSPRLHTHLAWLLSQLEPRQESIRELIVGDVKADLFCYSRGSCETPPSLPREIRSRANALGMEIEIDHYVDADDKE